MNDKIVNRKKKRDDVNHNGKLKKYYCFNQNGKMRGQKKDKKTLSFLDWVEHPTQFLLK